MTRVSRGQNYLWPDIRGFQTKTDAVQIWKFVRSCPDYRAFKRDRVILTTWRPPPGSFRSGHINFRNGTSTCKPWPKTRSDVTNANFNCKAVEVTEVIEKVSSKKSGWDETKSVRQSKKKHSRTRPDVQLKNFSLKKKIDPEWSICELVKQFLKNRSKNSLKN